MFASEEMRLIGGSQEEIEDFVDCDRCLIVDWRGTEEEALDDARRFLPEGSLSYRRIKADSGSPGILIQFMGREDSISLHAQPQNNFRVLLRLSALILPDFDMKFFRCTDESDTHGFLIRPKAWWNSYRSSYPGRYGEIFRDMSALTEIWNLDGLPGSPRAQSKPWWKFWG